jgi:hypothetical protein
MSMLEALTIAGTALGALAAIPPLVRQYVALFRYLSGRPWRVRAKPKNKRRR